MERDGAVDHRSSTFYDGGDEGLLTSRSKHCECSAAGFQFKGKLELVGSVQVSFIDDIMKRVAITMACHSLIDKCDWHPLIPFIAKEIYALRNEQTFNVEKSELKIISNVKYLLEEDCITALSYVDKSLPEITNSIDFTWDFVSPLNEALVVRYELKIDVFSITLEEKEDCLKEDFKLLQPANHAWDAVCTFVVDHFLKESFSPDKALRLLAPSSKELERLFRPRLSFWRHGCAQKPYGDDDDLWWFYKGGDQGLLTGRLKVSERFPVDFRLRGKLQVIGSVQGSPLDDICKQMAITMACHSLIDEYYWHPLIPFVAREIYALLKAETSTISKGDMFIAANFECIFDKKYITALSYVEKYMPEITNFVHFIWDLGTQPSKPLIVRYELDIDVFKGLCDEKEDPLKKNCKLLQPTNHTWDAVCTFVVDHFPEKSFSPDKALQLLAHSSKKLERFFSPRLPFWRHGCAQEPIGDDDLWWFYGGGKEGLLTGRSKHRECSPAGFKFRGKLQVIGSVPSSFIDDILKRVVIILSCHSLYNNCDWRPLIPFIAREIHALRNAQTFNVEKSNSKITSNIEYLLEGKYITALSYVDKSLPQITNSVDFTWDFVTPLNEALVVRYELNIDVFPIKFDERKDYLEKDFKLLQPANHAWDAVCTFVVDHFLKESFSPYEALRLLAPSSKELERLLEIQPHFWRYVPTREPI